MPQRFQHILVPVDFTEKNEPALQIALDVALQNKSRVTLLHVIETIGENDEEIERFYERLQERAEASLTSLSQAFEAARVAVEWKTRLGRRAPEIVQYAMQHDVDLIILSSHPIDEQAPVKSLSTVSYQVSLLSPCSVLLVK